MITEIASLVAGAFIHYAFCKIRLRKRGSDITSSIYLSKIAKKTVAALVENGGKLSATELNQKYGIQKKHIEEIIRQFPDLLTVHVFKRKTGGLCKDIFLK